tara:strand:- start:3474 stop:3968 length:495 start_codon:yes stop_codon:yes gene_type:complete
LGRLVLDALNEYSSPFVIGITSSVQDIQLVYELNVNLGFALSRSADAFCRNSKIIARHALFRGSYSGSDVNLFWNYPEDSEWVSKSNNKGTGLFSKETEDAPLLNFIIKPKNISALITIDPELSQNEMVILQNKLLMSPSIVNHKQIPWLSIRGRENLLFETIK